MVDKSIWYKSFGVATALALMDYYDSNRRSEEIIKKTINSLYSSIRNSACDTKYQLE